MIGKILGGRYEIIEQIGEGGMALVYKARCQLLDRLVAVKILKNEFVNDDEFVRKFKRESQAAASLSHPNIVNIYDVGVEDNGNSPIHYIVMEYVKGGTLKDLIVKKGLLSKNETINYSIQIASALEDAHKNSIVHRDIKPQNIMITEGNIIKVTDFGIARATTSSTVTTTSNVLGSVHYFSPEQARGGYTDEKSDIYSLGIVMYEMATGKLPYEGDSPITVALKHVQEEIVPPREVNPEISKGLENIILKAVEKRQVDRYRNISEIIKDLGKIKINMNDNIISSSNDTESHTRIIPAVGIEDKNNIKKEKKKKKNGGFKFILLGILAAFLVTAGAFFGFAKIRDIVRSGGEIEMPQIVEMEEDEARQTIEDLDLKFEVRSRVRSKDVEAGLVISQDVKVGTKLKKGYPVKVTISEGNDLVEVPNLTNKSISEVEKILEDLGLEIDIEYKSSEFIKVDNVIDQYPEKFSEVEPGTRIKVTVSQGKEVKNVIMPNITGWNLADAKNEILRLGLEVGKVDEQESTSVKKGLVIWQGYEQGTELESKTVVDLFVSSGIKEDEDVKEDETNNNEDENNENKNDDEDNENKNDDEDNETNNNEDESNKESTLTFTVTPLQDKEETQIKVIRIQDGVSEVVHNKAHSTKDGNVTLTQKGKLGSKFDIYYNDEFQTTLINE